MFAQTPATASRSEFEGHPPYPADLYQEISARPLRTPDYEADNLTFELLAGELTRNPQMMLQKLAEVALIKCQADTAGVIVLDSVEGAEVFRWEAAAGLLTPPIVPVLRAESPCEVCVRNDSPTLMYLPERSFAGIAPEPKFVELLLVPFHHQSEPVGTVCVVMHQFERRFDQEDLRFLRRLAAFASAGWQLWQAQERLEDCVAQRTAELLEKNTALHQEMEEREFRDEQRKDLLLRLVITHDAERRRVARELHEDLAQRVALLEIELELVKRNPPSQPLQVAERLHSLSMQVEKLGNDLRDLSHTVYPSIVEDLGLEAALRSIVRKYQFSDANVQFEGACLTRAVPTGIATTLYRITQAILVDVFRNSRGSAVRVHLVGADKEVSVTIHADGAVLTPATLLLDAGSGLVNLQECAQMVGGQLLLESIAGNGTQLRVSVPWPALVQANDPCQKAAMIRE